MRPSPSEVYLTAGEESGYYTNWIPALYWFVNAAAHITPHQCAVVLL